MKIFIHIECIYLIANNWMFSLLWEMVSHKCTAKIKIIVIKEWVFITAHLQENGQNNKIAQRDRLEPAKTEFAECRVVSSDTNRYRWWLKTSPKLNVIAFQLSLLHYTSTSTIQYEMSAALQQLTHTPISITNKIC